MRRILLLSSLLSLLAAFAGVARAEAPPTTPPPAAAPAAPVATNPLSGIDFSAYAYDPSKSGSAAEMGARFFEDLKAKDPALWAAAYDRARYDLQKDEARKFVHQRKFVIAAYGVIWTILVAFVVAMWMRQRKLSADLLALEARLRAEDGK